MKFLVKKTWQGIEVSLKQSKGNGQLFYGPVERMLKCIQGHYDHTNEKLWPEKTTKWEDKFIEQFITNCENAPFIGVYLLWFIASLKITAPTTEANERAIYNGKPGIYLMDNIEIDGYNILIKSYQTECKDDDKIITEISDALEGFDIDKTFKQMVDCFTSLHPEITVPKWRVVRFFQKKKTSRYNGKSSGKNLSIFKNHFKINRKYFIE